ncbi:hypothetical protein KAJ87_03750 [Candidatus Pacearchaeota archaeon]|nr:hypothetical protein [Candidatus Pacearchaeota archaeon]
MAITNFIELIQGQIAKGTIGAFLGILLILGIATYIYFALVWMTIAKKLGYKYPWLAWIPIANIAMVFQLGGFHWALVFLILIPVLGWSAIGIIAIIATWRIFEKRKYPGWLALIPIAGGIPLIGWLASIAYPIIIGLVAWKDK